MDRNNIGFGFSGMKRDLGIGASYAGLASGIFFLGYLFLQIPSGIWAQRWSAKKVVAIAMTLWGVFAVLTGVVQSLQQLLIVRFLTGLCEGAVLPPIIFILKHWFPQHERARANAYWMVSIPFSLMLMAPISGFILTFADWRLMFIIEGLMPIVWVAVWWLCVEDRPGQAKWLSPVERAYIEDSLAIDEKHLIKQTVDWKGAMVNRNIWLLVFCWFFTQIGGNGVTMWMPTVVKSFTSSSNLAVGFLTALAWLAGCIIMPLNSWHSDRTGERKYHVAVPMVLTGVFFFLSVLAGRENPVMAMIFLILCGGFAISFNGVWWTVPTMFVGDEVLAVAIGLINAIGNLGGFFGPWIFGFVRSVTSSFFGSILIAFLSCLVGALLMAMVKYERKAEVQVEA